MPDIRRRLGLALPLLLLTLLLAGWPGAARAATGRLALLIGNSAYEEESALNFPDDDARALAERLRALGFDFACGGPVVDADLNRMQACIEEFQAAAARLPEDGLALLFFSGHGLDIDGEGFLAPVDFAGASTKRQVERNAVSVQDDLIAPLARLRAPVVLILDACRNNPLEVTENSGGKSLRASRGAPRARLADKVPHGGILVAYATQQGAVAWDGSGPLGPYVTALLAALDRPGLEIHHLLRETRKAVEAMQIDQIPDFDSRLNVDVVLNPSAGGSGAADPCALAERALAQAEAAGSAAAWRAFQRDFAESGCSRALAYARFQLSLLDRASGEATRPQAQSLPQAAAPQMPLPPPPPVPASQAAEDPRDPPFAAPEVKTETASARFGPPPGDTPAESQAADAIPLPPPLPTSASFQSASSGTRAQTPPPPPPPPVAVAPEPSAAERCAEGASVPGYLEGFAGAWTLPQPIAPLREACRQAVAEDPDAPLLLALRCRVELRAEICSAPAEAGDPLALTVLAQLHLRGFGLARDPDQALGLLLKAGEQGFPLADLHLAEMLLSGTGVEADAAMAATLLEQAGEAGMPEAWEKLADLYSSGGPGLAPDPAKARAAKKRATGGL